MKQMIDVAYNYLKQNGTEMDFKTLYEGVAKQLNLDETNAKRRKGSFYSQLMQDRRFQSLSGNRWDLRENAGSEALSKVDEMVADAEDDGNLVETDNGIEIQDDEEDALREEEKEDE